MFVREAYTDRHQHHSIGHQFNNRHHTLPLPMTTFRTRTTTLRIRPARPVQPANYLHHIQVAPPHIATLHHRARFTTALLQANHTRQSVPLRMVHTAYVRHVGSSMASETAEACIRVILCVIAKICPAYRRSGIRIDLDYMSFFIRVNINHVGSMRRMLTQMAR
jgi:hypothetical protein